MSTAKQDILDEVRAANGGPSSSAREAEYERIRRDYRQSGTLDAAGRLDLFVDLLLDYDATVYRCNEQQIQEAVAQALNEHGKNSLLIPRDLPRDWLPSGFQFLRESIDYNEIDSSEGVLTDCALAIAATGTIVLRHGAGEARRALSLIPDYHLCVVYSGQVFETVPEGIRQMRSFGNVPLTTISGPSATADIEMTRIKGVHGPRTLDVILVS
jgi:L-lactate dehydrogenase complex protein LldG